MPSEVSQFALLRAVFAAAACLFCLLAIIGRTRWGLAIRRLEADGLGAQGIRWTDVIVFVALILTVGLPYFAEFQLASAVDAAPAKLPEITAPQVAAGAMLQLLIVVFLILYLRLVRGVNPATALGLDRLSAGGVLRQGMVTLIITFIAAQVVNWIVCEWLLGSPPPEETDQQVVQIFKHASQTPLRLAIIFVCVIAAPLTEELMYRGFIFGIARHLVGAWPAIVFSAVMFSLAHQNLMAAVPLFVLGLGFAISYQRSQNLLVPMLAHALFNAWNLAALAWSGP